MDEYTANPYETEKEAQRVLRKMQAKKNADAAKAAEAKAGVEESRAKLREMGYLKGGSGGGGVPSDKMDKMKKMNYKSGGVVGSASKRADGCATKGKTKGRMV
jgi:hypothetical protein